jgi:hypothetical protein
MSKEAAAFARLAEWQKDYAAISEFYRGLLLECQAYKQRADKAEREFWNDPSAERLEVAISLRLKVQLAIEFESALSRQLTASDLVEQKFKEKHPGLQATAIECAEIREQEARENYDRVYALERKHLSEFGEEEVEASPPVKRARRQLESAQRTLAHVKSAACGPKSIAGLLRNGANES